MKMKRIMMRIFMVLILTIGITEMGNTVYPTKVEASVKQPTVKTNKMTLYVGYKTYSMEISNLSDKSSIVYKSSNTKIATVNSKGMIKPLTKGSADINVTVKQNSKTYHFKVKITVKKPSISLEKFSDYLNTGDTYKFSAKSIGTEKKIEWSVSNSSIASVSKTGTVTAVKSGFVTIYAKAGTLIAKCVVTIGTNRLGTLSKEITLYNNKTIWISANDYIDGEKLTASVDNQKVISCTLGKKWIDGKISLNLKPKATGSATITIATDKSNDKLVLNIAVSDKPAPNKQLTAEEVYEKCREATVEIASTSDDGTALGSGFFIDDGIIVTNYHVISGTNEITIKTYNEKEYKVTDILGYDEKLDIAILKINSKNKSLVMIQTPVKVGEDIYTIGSPYGLTGSMTKGMVSSASRVIDDVDYIQFDAAISKGNSGGPLLNAYGEVMGINTMYYRFANSLDFAININEIQKINTNQPLTVSDYHTKYEDLKQQEFIATMIHEDSMLSQSPISSQSVPSDIGVEGTVTASEPGDNYTFTMQEPGWFVAEVDLDNSADTQNLSFSIYDENMLFKGKAIKYVADNYEYLTYYLTPGQYYIFLSKENNGLLGDIHYLYTTSQIYDIY